MEVGSTEKSVRIHKDKAEKEKEPAVIAQKKAEQMEARRKKEATELALLTCADNGIEFRCAKCRNRFLSDAKLQVHITKNICLDKSEVSQAKDQQRNIKKVVMTKAAEAREVNERRVERMALVDIILRPEDELKSHGIKLVEVEGAFVVESVKEDGLAFRTFLVDEGYILKKVNGQEPSPGCLDGDDVFINVEGSDDVQLHLEFRQPHPMALKTFTSIDQA